MSNQTASGTSSGIPFTRSLYGKLLGIMLLIGLIPVIVNTASGYFQFQKALTGSVIESQKIFSDGQTAFLLNWAQERKQDLQTLAGVARIASLNPETARGAIQQYHQMWGIYETIFLIAPDGSSIVTSDGKPLNLADRAYIKEAFTGKTAISEAILSRATNHVIIAIAAPIISENKVVAVIGASVTLDSIAALLETNRIGATSDSYLVNSTGYFVTAPRFLSEMKQAGMVKERAELEVKLNTQASQALTRGQSGSGVYRNYLGDEVIGQYTWLPELKMGLVSEKHTAEANAASAQLVLFSSALLGGFALAILLAAFLIARAITRPVQQIAQTASLLAEGETDQSLDYRSRDEYGLLADAFRKMIDYQKKMTRLAARISDGDLTENVQPQSQRDQLGQAFMRMTQNLRRSVGQVAENAITLNQASEQLVATAAHAGHVTEQIAATMQQVAKGITQETASITGTAHSVEQMSRAIDGVARGAQEQTVSVTKAANITSQISVTVDQVAGNAQSVTRDSAGAAEAARLGAQSVSDTVKGMQRIKTKVSLSAQAVAEMGKRSDEIGAIVETIDDIASQTNLLALNAAIEAARAGEHGKGFAVVADEVRKLAERSANATKEIGGLIKGIQKTVAEAVSAMEEGGREVENGVRLANESGQALSAILTAAQEVYRQAEQAGQGATQMRAASGQLVSAVDGVSAIVEENTAATEELSAGTTEVTRAIENIAAVSEENSAAIEEVSAAAQEMSSQVSEVGRSARALAEMAKALQSAIAQFNIN